MSQPIQPGNIIFAVCHAFETPSKSVLAKFRDKPSSRVRYAAMLLLRESGMNYSEIGRATERDHSTVFAGLLHAQDLMRTDYDFVQRIGAARGIAAEWRSGDVLGDFVPRVAKVPETPKNPPAVKSGASGGRPMVYPPGEPFEVTEMRRSISEGDKKFRELLQQEMLQAQTESCA